MGEDDEWEIDSESHPDLEGIDQGVPAPIMRAICTPRTLTILANRAWMIDDAGFYSRNFDERSEAGISILELGETEMDGYGWELTVSYLAEGDRARAERAISTWAGRVGYRRVWFPDRIYEPGKPPRVSSQALVECPTCRHTWHGRGRRFWHQIWEFRMFPPACPLCGSTMPQWRVRRTPYITPEERAERAAERRRLQRLKQQRRGEHPDGGRTFAEELDDLVKNWGLE
jgi:hypothetical protein